MALWIIAIVLIIVFFPILFGVAATAAMIIIPFGILIFGVGSIIYFAGAAVANPQLGRRVGLGIIILDFILQLPPIQFWMYIHDNGFLYDLRPIVIAYTVCLLMLSKNRGIKGKKAVAGTSLLLLGATFQTALQIMMRSYYITSPLEVLNPLIIILFPLVIILGYALLMTVPTHNETSAEEKNGVLLITWGYLADEVCTVLRVLFSVAVGADVIVTTPITTLIRYGSLLLLIVGIALYAKSMLDSGKNKKK